MCGIAGYYYKSGATIDDTGRILAILEQQRHRGPDDTGVRVFSLTQRTSGECDPEEPTRLTEPFEGVLGFNRLSILDLSVNGHQPMCSPDGKVFLSLNGEVYNAFDFKDGLIADGYRFRGTSDTEVVLYLYLKHGFDGMIRQLNGMFAIVVVDLHQGQAFFARDRFGIKPLYFFENADLFAFGSEIKSFLLLPGFRPELNHAALDEYLLFRSTTHHSLYKNVEALEPGTYRGYSPAHGFRTVKYFDIEDYQRKNHSTVDGSAIRATLGDSVRRQLISDVKLGCQLSGGVDSSLVTYFARSNRNNGMFETVSVVMDDQDFSEEQYIDEVGSRLDLVSHKFHLDASYYLESFRTATWHFEGPLNHPNTIGIYLLSQRAKDYVTVLLSGEGADEVFGGYGRFALVNHPFHPRTLLAGLRNNQSEPFAFLSRHFSEANRVIMGSAFLTPALATLLKEDFSFDRATCSRRRIFDGLSGSLFDRQIKYEVKTYLPDLLMRQDKMSMAHSIENRVPFLDNELVERSFDIPERYMISPGPSGANIKLILKNMAADIFGRAFAWRSKQGFGIPLRAFFQDLRFKEYLRDEILPGIESRGIFNGGVVRGWLSNVSRISSAELDALWIMVSFEAWANEFDVE